MNELTTGLKPGHSSPYGPEKKMDLSFFTQCVLSIERLIEAGGQQSIYLIFANRTGTSTIVKILDRNIYFLGTTAESGVMILEVDLHDDDKTSRKILRGSNELVMMVDVSCPYDYFGNRKATTPEPTPSSAQEDFFCIMESRPHQVVSKPPQEKDHSPKEFPRPESPKSIAVK